MSTPITIASVSAKTALVPLGELGGPWREVFANGIPVSWVRVTSTDGTVGDSIGLVDPALLLTPAVLRQRQYADRLIGTSFTSPRSVWTALRTMPRGQDWKLATQTALGQIDIALWDLVGKASNRPLHAMLGAHLDRVPIYISWGLGRTPLDELVECYRTQVTATDARMVKMAIGNEEPEDDARKVADLRSALGDELRIAIDAQAQWSATTARDMLDRLRSSSLFWVEEPTGVASEDRALGALGHPVATGENLLSVRDFADLLAGGFRGYIQPDIVRLGGVTPALDVLALANTYGVAVAPHCYRMLSAPLVGAATAGGVVEYLGLESVVSEAFVIDPVRPVDGALPLTGRPGIGDVVDPDAFHQAGDQLDSLTL